MYQLKMLITLEKSVGREKGVYRDRCEWPCLWMDVGRAMQEQCRVCREKKYCYQLIGEGGILVLPGASRSCVVFHYLTDFSRIMPASAEGNL